MTSTILSLFTSEEKTLSRVVTALIDHAHTQNQERGQYWAGRTGTRVRTRDRDRIDFLYSS